MASEDINKKLLFCVAPLKAGGPPVLMIGIPRECYEFIQNGMSQDFDLTAIGLPIKMMVFGGEDHSACLKIVEDACKASGVPILDERRRDFSFSAADKKGK